MNQLKEYRHLIVIIFSIFALTLIGAVYSPSFTLQQTYLEIFLLLGSLLFIFSVLVVLAYIGFSSFAIYLAIVLSAIMSLFGVEKAFLVIFMTYGIWGFVFSIELLLIDNSVEGAIVWFKDRYTFDSFKAEYYAFYPMIILVYILIEYIPTIFEKNRPKRFSPKALFFKMKDILELPT